MKHAVIVAHPNAQSFNLTMARAYETAARALGHAVIVRDLYRLGFNPCLAADELPSADGFHPGADVASERALLADVDVFCFVYPLWLDSPPAILKGYLERVFGYGFAFERGPAGNTPLLEGRSMISVSSSGAPTAWVRQTGDWSALSTLFDGHFAEVCGLSFVDHLHFGDITPGLTAEAVRAAAAEVESAVKRRFGASA
ncbi:MAG TPA: NAD(P)H-dependent oxidoreductase [Caulobacteraceae bacterium]|nr:NAD(P)H-dependent oxidoreductase [Caulobacteraceae bacterium]